jgi:hypothetical protein
LDIRGNAGCNGWLVQWKLRPEARNEPDAGEYATKDIRMQVLKN